MQHLWNDPHTNLFKELMTEFTYNAMPRIAQTDASVWKSLALAATVHLFLLAFLWVGVQWQSQESTAVEAEVWDMTVRQAAPLSVPEVPVEEPKEIEPPKPVQQEEVKEDPEIALEQEKKRKLEEKKKIAELELAKKKEEKLAEEKLKKEKLEKELLEKKKLAKEKAEKDKIFQEDMRRLNGQVAKSGSGGFGDALKSTGNNRGDPSYNAKVAAKIKANTIYLVNDASANNPTVEFVINLFPDGSLKGPVKKTKSSGNPAFDEAVEKAIDKSQPFPRDKSGEVPSSLTIVHRMKD
nr:energy transducer TonB [uncultured Undibacterium sp.]